MKVIFRPIYLFFIFLTGIFLFIVATLPINERETGAIETHAVANDTHSHEEEREQISEFLHHPGLTMHGFNPPVRISPSFPSFSTSYTIDIPYPPPEGYDSFISFHPFPADPRKG